jgi:MFS family permease
MTDAAASAPAVSDRPAGGGAVLALLALTQFLMTVDATVMNVSISALVDDLDTTVVAIQGVITAYTLVMAAAMITGAKIGDLLGRRRALRIGLVVYACGSGITSLAPNVVVLLFGWSILEGLGAALIMPTVVALVAGNFTGKQRAVAYGALAAAAAVAVAAGPIIGGFVTAEFSWRWVFAAEVLIAGGILLGSRAITDVPGAGRPQLDGAGAVLSASGLALVVFGVLKSGSWGWVEPRVAGGEGETPQLGGISLVAWMILAGLLLLWGFTIWLRHCVDTGREPLVDPALFSVDQLRGGLIVLLLQYLVMMGVFFTMPLFFSIVLGLDAFDTGLRMLPLSLALILVAPTVPKLLPEASPRRVATSGLVLMLAATLLLAVRLDEGATVGITTVPFLLLGAGMGALASQLGNVLVSSVPSERGGEVGGLQYTAQNLGSSLGTALVGAVVVASLGTSFIDQVQSSPELDEAVQSAATITISGGVEFISDAEATAVLASTDLTQAEQDAILLDYQSARLSGLRQGMVVLSLFVVITLFAARRLPGEPVTAPAEEADPVGAGSSP